MFRDKGKETKVHGEGGGGKAVPNAVTGPQLITWDGDGAKSQYRNARKTWKWVNSNGTE